MSGSDSNFPQSGQSGQEAILLPADLVAMLNQEAKASRKSIPNLIRQIIEDQIDGREASRIMKRIKEGKEKTIPAEEVYARLGI